MLSCWDADRLDLGRVGVKPLMSAQCATRFAFRANAQAGAKPFSAPELPAPA